MTVPTQSTEPNLPATSESALWRLSIVAEPEPLLLPRVLQKLAVPEVDFRKVHYETATPGGTTGIELLFQASPERARLVAARLQKIVRVSTVTLQPADNQ